MNEAEEIKKRYERRKAMPEKSRYSYFNVGNLFIVQERQRKILQLLKKNGFENLGDKVILDIGCGSGGWMRDFVQWGARPENLYGVDLLQDRIDQAKKISPNMHFFCQNAENLEFEEKKFDIVLLSTCLTSIFDKEMKRRISSQALRVLKDSGMILWYDFRYNNPANPDVKGIAKNEIKELFGRCVYDFNLVTLAPPIARILAPVSWLACEMLSKLSFLKTHYLAVIKKKS